MSTGFFEIEPGSGRTIGFHALTNRTEIGSARIQRVLAAASSTASEHHLVCSCGFSAGHRFRLTVRRLPGGAFTLVRDDVAEHLQDCIFQRETDGLLPPTVRTDGIFSAPVAEDDLADAVECEIGGIAGGGPQYDTFGTYARRLVSRATSTALEQANPCRSAPLRMPSMLETFEAFERAVVDLKFQDGSDGFTAAALHDGSLRVGLVYELPSLQRGHAIPLNVWWWRKPGMALGLATVDGDVLAGARASITRFGSILAPPCLLVAFQHESGRIHRMFVHQVCVDGCFLVPTDSSYERAFAADLIRLKEVFAKPVLLNDWATTLCRLGFGTESEIRLLFRPDFIVLRRSAGGVHRLHIREVRGFKVGMIEKYDELLRRKAFYYRDLPTNGIWRYGERDGWEYLQPSTYAKPTEWLGVPITIDGS